MLTVHHLGVSQSERIVWLCEELGIVYALELYERDPVTRLAPARYKVLHPMETAPVITDGGLVMAESGAIVEYIIGTYGDGRLSVKPGQPGFADYVFWLHFANGTLMTNEMVLMALQGSKAEQTSTAAFFGARADRAYGLIETQLGKTKYLAGDELTAADIMTVFALTTMRAFNGRSLENYPNIRLYLARIGDRPAYNRAMKKGDPTLTPMLT